MKFGFDENIDPAFPGRRCRHHRGDPAVLPLIELQREGFNGVFVPDRLRRPLRTGERARGDDDIRPRGGQAVGHVVSQIPCSSGHQGDSAIEPKHFRETVHGL